VLFGGKQFQLRLKLLRLAIAISCTSIGLAYLRIFASDYSFQIRKLSNDASGTATAFRPDELEIRTEAFWAIALQLAAIALANELVAKNQNSLSADFRGSR
jgi:hypothetical protein